MSTTTARRVSPVRLERQGAVLVATIDNPPVNSSSAAVRAGLLAAVEELTADAALAAAVLVGARGSFISGSDIKEFSGTVADPLLPAVIAAIEACPKPVVAALDGAALGGGLELALGCDARIATPRCQLGLPEVTLGMVPGAGGTQRLPRLAGREAALDLIVTGRRVGGDRARALGIVDVTAEPAALLSVAVELAASLEDKRRVIRLEVPTEDEERVDAAAARALRTGRNRRQVREAVRLVMLAGQAPVAEALAQERHVFEELRAAPEAAALRHVFFAERAAMKVEGLNAEVALPIRRTGVVGAGTMGSGIATALLLAGYETTLVDLDARALEAGLKRVRGNLTDALARGKLTPVAAEAATAKLRGGCSIEGLARCDLVVEAVYEALEVKSAVLRILDACLGPDAVLASNTSYLDLDLLAGATSRPEAVVGLHFFNPAHVMRLVEVVRGAATSPRTLKTALMITKAMGKVSVIAQVGEGFIGNRVYAAYRRQCELMLEEGALPEQIDAALTAFGFAMGPFAVADLSGLDIAWAMRKRRATGRDPRERYVAVADRLCEAGRLGRKTGSGYYDYASSSAVPDPEVTRLIEACSAEKEITRRRLDDDEIVERALLAIVNEAALLLEEGIAQRPSDVDVALVLGYGFPRHEGGPLWWGSRQPADRVASGLELLARRTGFGFRAGPVARVLDEVRTGI